MSILKSCPFCGGNPELEDCRTIWVVSCNCGATVLGDRAPEPEDEMPDEYWLKFEKSAIDKWNSRA